MTLLYRSDLYLEHDTSDGHPERADRLRAIERRFAEEGLDAFCTKPTWPPATDEALLRVHTPEHLARVRAASARGIDMLDPDTIVSSRSEEAARLASGASIDAVDRVLKGERKTALCLHRPPGHHALADATMGFCLYNHAAVAARHAIQVHGLERVLVVDWDVHHGNGTQDLFYDDPQVFFMSIHRYPFWPGSGAADETGTGLGLGSTWNTPVRFGVSRKAYLEQFTLHLEQFAERARPQLVIASAGFDAHRLDPIGSLNLESEDFVQITRRALEVALAWCGGKLVSLLEGGYHLHALAESAAAHLRTLQEDEPASRC